MQFHLDEALLEFLPQFSLGVLVAKKIKNRSKISATQQLLDGICAQLRKNLVESELEDHPPISAWREAFKKFDINPRKYPPMTETLLRSALLGERFESKDALHDLLTYLSLKQVLPVIAFDLDKTTGEICLGFADGSKDFTATNTPKKQFPPKGEIVFHDDKQVLSRRFNARESADTQITASSENVIIFFADIGLLGKENLAQLLEENRNFLQRYIQGEMSCEILSAEKTVVEIGATNKTAQNTDLTPQEKPVFATKTMKFSEGITENETSNSGILEMTWSLRLKKHLDKTLHKLFPEENISAEISYPKDFKHGDYSANSAMILGKKRNENPMKIAQEIIDELGKIPGVERVEAVNPGFINFHLSNVSLNNEIAKILNKGDSYGESNFGDKKTALVEFGSPNVAKPLGAHHLPTLVLGHAIYKMYKKAGYLTVSINHLGDWGTQFGKLICAYKAIGSKKDIEERGIAALLDLYVRFHDMAKEDPALADKAREEFKKLENGDEENKDLWHWFVLVTMKEINPVIESLGIKFDEVIGESFFEDKLVEILELGKEKGVFTLGENGAFVADFGENGLPTCVVQKSDGATLYITRDLAAIKYRVERWQPEKIIYVVDVAQSLHFKQNFELAKRLEISGETELIHADFGRMSLPEGAMSTRAGKIIPLADLIDEAKSRAKRIILEKSPDMEEEQAKELAEKIGVGALKYNILSQNRQTNITFVWDKIISLEGNSGPYLQYSYARAQSVLRKIAELKEAAISTQEEDELQVEIDLKKLFPKYTEYLVKATQECRPNILAQYTYELAKSFNAFYNSAQIIGSGPETIKRRVNLVQSSAQLIKNSLELLGISVVEKM
jgi:arginyl-tRNA synthetase